MLYNAPYIIAYIEIIIYTLEVVVLDKDSIMCYSWNEFKNIRSGGGGARKT